MTNDYMAWIIVGGTLVCFVVLYFAIRRLFDTVSPIRDRKKRPLQRRRKPCRGSGPQRCDNKNNTFQSGV